MITEDYVSFEIAKLLNEKGFNGVLPFIYVDTEKSDRKVHLTDTLCDYNDGHIEHVISAPTIQMAMKWLRETHNLNLEIRITNHSISNMVNIVKYYWIVMNAETCKWMSESTVYNVHGFKTYEQACEDGIKYCLEKML